jgi:hypothetical protein
VVGGECVQRGCTQPVACTPACRRLLLRRAWPVSRRRRLLRLLTAPGSWRQAPVSRAALLPTHHDRSKGHPVAKPTQALRTLWSGHLHMLVGRVGAASTPLTARGPASRQEAHLPPLISAHGARTPSAPGCRPARCHFRTISSRAHFYSCTLRRQLFSQHARRKTLAPTVGRSASRPLLTATAARVVPFSGSPLLGTGRAGGRRSPPQMDMKDYI